MNENNEKNFLPNDADNNNSTEAFKAEFNDAVVKSSDNNATNPQEVVNESNCNSEAYKEHIDADANELDYKNQESDHHANLCDSVGNQDNISDSSDNEVVSDPNAFATDFTTVEEVRKKRGQKRKHSVKALIRESNLAVFLSALSVILLVALAALLSLGILPAGNRMVYVGISTLGPIETQNGTAPAEMLENFKNSVVIIEVTRSQNGSTGSGIVISEDGYIVTNYHVIEDAKKISVKFYEKELKLYATVVGYSERDDIAVIKVESEGLRPAIFANSANCRLGDRVYAIGAPEGSEFGWTVTSGIISNPLRELKIYASDYVLEKKMYVLQTDTPVNPGNSGGPLINTRGEVVGIITLKRSDAAGLGFALPSSASLEIIEAIIESGNADRVNSSVSKGRPLIGIVGVGLEANVWYQQTSDGVQVVTESFAQKHPDICIMTPIAGVYVTSLNPELDASNYLLPGDVITHVNGKSVYVTYDIMDIVNEFNGGDTVKVTFVRGDETKTVSIVLGEEK